MEKERSSFISRKKDPNTDTRSNKQLCYVMEEAHRCLNETINFFIEDYLLKETHIFNNDTCIVMFLHNLAQPQWSHIPCGEKVIGDIFCSVKENSKTIDTSIQTTSGLPVCQKGLLKKTKICFELMWHTYIPGLSNRRTLSIHIFNSLFKFAWLGDITQCQISIFCLFMIHEIFPQKSQKDRYLLSLC